MKKNHLVLKVAVVMVGLFLLSSCASIVSKGNYPLSISSNPIGAKVSITDKSGTEIFVGNTPASVKLKAGAGFFAKAEYQVKLSSPGYDDKVIPVHFKMDGWYWGNILFGGLIGMLIVDPATGAMWKIEDGYINETLTGAPNAMANPEIKIVDINDVPVKLKEHLEKLN